MDSDNMDNTENAEANQYPVDLSAVYPAKVFYDLWKRNNQPEYLPDGRANAYEIIKRTRIYDANGNAAYIDFTHTLPDSLREWGSKIISENLNLHDSNEAALRETHDLLMELRDRDFHPIVRHKVLEDGCINLRVNIGAKSYFTVRVHHRACYTVGNVTVPSC